MYGWVFHVVWHGGGERTRARCAASLSTGEPHHLWRAYRRSATQPDRDGKRCTHPLKQRTSGSASVKCSRPLLASLWEIFQDSPDCRNDPKAFISIRRDTEHCKLSLNPQTQVVSDSNMGKLDVCLLWDLSCVVGVSPGRSSSVSWDWTGA